MTRWLVRGTNQPIRSARQRVQVWDSVRADRLIHKYIELFRQDAARWIEPQQVADPERVTFTVACSLLFRYPSLRAMAWFRLAQLSRERRIRGVVGYLQRRILRVYGLDMAASVPVKGGLYIAHPVGSVLHAESIGANVTVIGQVTLGTRNDARWPVIGDDVFIGVGSCVLGGVKVGSDARIGANAVVLNDVPDGVTVAGIPACVVQSRQSRAHPRVQRDSRSDE